MKYAVGLVLAALAVTAAHAGHLQNLRANKEDELASKGLLEDETDAGLNDEPAKKKDALMVTVKGPAGSDDIKINIMDLIGSGSGQADILDVVSAELKTPSYAWLRTAGDKDPIAGKGANDGSAEDLSWLSSEESGNEDPAGTKGSMSDAEIEKFLQQLLSDGSGEGDHLGAKGGAGDPLGAKGGAKGALSLEDEEEEEEVDPIGAKGGAGDPLGAKGGAKGALSLEDEEEEEEVDPIGAKGGAKGALSLEDEEEEEEVDPIGAKGGAGDPLGAKGGAKGALSLEDEEEEEEVDPIGAKGGAGDPLGAKGGAKGALSLEDEEEEEEVDPIGAKGGAGDPLGAKGGAKGALSLEDEEEEEEVDPIGAKGGAGDPLGAKGGAKGALSLDDEEEDEEVDPIGAKGGDKSTKASKSTKAGAEGGSLAGLFDEGTDGLVGDEGESVPLMAGGKKGTSPAVENEPVFSEADLDDSPMQSELTGTKDSKATK
ncbi:unnamed protein product [Hyaloperonospora brassicae]|uniref:RxLR effector candidate protein n=1 Tax=Hyaloperonospora brassicae TaxID=162125 RepID=A0AAV0UAF4_HYABA|nr:unnamed protein product [Hyaloperonospora brassicae]